MEQNIRIKSLKWLRSWETNLQSLLVKKKKKKKTVVLVAEILFVSINGWK